MTAGQTSTATPKQTASVSVIPSQLPTMSMSETMSSSLSGTATSTTSQSGSSSSVNISSVSQESTVRPSQLMTLFKHLPPVQVSPLLSATRSQSPTGSNLCSETSTPSQTSTASQIWSPSASSTGSQSISLSLTPSLTISGGLTERPYTDSNAERGCVFQSNADPQFNTNSVCQFYPRPP